MVTKNEALRIKHISQYCEEIGKDCDNCLFQDCFSKNEIRTAKSILGDWEEKEIYYGKLSRKPTTLVVGMKA